VSVNPESCEGTGQCCASDGKQKSTLVNRLASEVGSRMQASERAIWVASKPACEQSGWLTILLPTAHSAVTAASMTCLLSLAQLLAVLRKELMEIMQHASEFVTVQNVISGVFQTPSAVLIAVQWRMEQKVKLYE
jgi:hypothetical protein